MTTERWTLLLFSAIGAANIVLRYLQGRHQRLENLDSPRSMATRLEDCLKSVDTQGALFERTVKAFREEVEELSRKSSQVPNHLNTRIGDFELAVERRLSRMEEIAARSRDDHERYERYFRDLFERRSGSERRTDSPV